MILVARILGKTSYGELGLIQATLGVFGIMAGSGLGGAATRFVAQYAKPDPERAGRIIALVIGSSFAALLVGSGLLIALSGQIANEVLEAPHLQSALIWGALVMVARVFRGIQNGVLAGFERFDAIAKVNVLEGVVALPALLFFASWEGIAGALQGLVVSAVIAWSVGRVMLIQELAVRKIQIRYEGALSDWRILTGYSLPSFLANAVAAPVLWMAMTLLAQIENGFAQLGLYNAAYQWHGPLIFLPMILMSVTIPPLVQEWEAGNKDRFRRIYLSITAFALLVTLLAAVPIALLSPWIMSLYGSEFREGWMVLVLLVLAAALHAVAKIASGALYGMNKAWWVLFVNISWAVVLLVSAFLLIEGYGAVGLGVSFLSAYAVSAVISVGLVFLASVSSKNWARAVKAPRGGEEMPS